MNKTQSKNFVSVVLLSFPSQAQYDLWYEKYITFYNSKAVEFLKKNGQLSQSANLVNDDNDLLAIAKLSQPILKTAAREALIKVKLDF